VFIKRVPNCRCVDLSSRSVRPHEPTQKWRSLFGRNFIVENLTNGVRSDRTVLTTTEHKSINTFVNVHKYDRKNYNYKLCNLSQLISISTHLSYFLLKIHFNIIFAFTLVSRVVWSMQVRSGDTYNVAARDNWALMCSIQPRLHHQWLGTRSVIYLNELV
jgi:hypothetical protein